MGWSGGGEAPVPEATRENAKTAQAQYVDFKNNYLPMVGEYLGDNTATGSAKADARGIATADVGQAYKGVPNNIVSAGATNGIGGSSRVTRGISDAMNEKGRTVGVGRNAADFGRKGQELQARLKIASVGRDLESNINAASQNSASGQVNKSISDARANQLVTDATISGVASVAGAATYKHMDGKKP